MCIRDSYSPAPVITKSIEKEVMDTIVYPTICAMKAAGRELLEETGYQYDDIKELGIGRVMLNRYIPQQYGFLALGAVKAPGQTIENGMEVVLVSLNEFKKMVISGEFNQMSAVGLWYKATKLYKF